MNRKVFQALGIVELVELMVVPLFCLLFVGWRYDHSRCQESETLKRPLVGHFVPFNVSETKLQLVPNNISLVFA